MDECEITTAMIRCLSTLTRENMNSVQVTVANLSTNWHEPRLARNVPNQLTRKQFVERLDQLGFRGLHLDRTYMQFWA